MRERDIKSCPKCGGEMDKGNFRGFSGIFIRFTKSESFWNPGKLEKVNAFACRRCGFIELYKEMKEKE